MYSTRSANIKKIQILTCSTIQIIVLYSDARAGMINNHSLVVSILLGKFKLVIVIFPKNDVFSAMFLP